MIDRIEWMSKLIMFMRLIVSYLIIDIGGCLQ